MHICLSLESFKMASELFLLVYPNSVKKLKILTRKFLFFNSPFSGQVINDVTFLATFPSLALVVFENVHGLFENVHRNPPHFYSNIFYCSINLEKDKKYKLQEEAAKTKSILFT